MYCVKCGQEIPNKSKFCFYCGFTVHDVIRDMMANEGKEIEDTTSSASIQQSQLEDVETDVVQPTAQLDSNDDDAVEYEPLVEESQQGSGTTRGKIGLTIAIIGQILIVATLIFDSMKLPLKATWTMETAETALTIYLAVILGVDILTYVFCGGRRVIRWIYKALYTGWHFLPLRGINFMGLIFVLMLDAALAVTFGFVMALLCIFVPVVPAFLTYRENK